MASRLNNSIPLGRKRIKLFVKESIIIIFNPFLYIRRILTIIIKNEANRVRILVRSIALYIK